MLGRTNTGVGGSGGLNFQVIGGTTAPSNPKENMIWVNTSTKITDWVFSATQPTAASGRVWFSTSTYSTAAFNALKKNGIQVYPMSAKQYVSGAWVDKTAKSYQGGVWVSWWDGTLYDAGNEYEAVTGGWKARAVKVVTVVPAVASAPNVTKNSDSVTLKIDTYAGGGVYEIANDIDVSGYNTLTFIGSGGGNGISGLCVYDRSVSSIGDTNITPFSNTLASRSLVSFSGTATVDLSGINKKVCIGIALYNNSTVPTVTMKKAFLS